MVGDETVTLVNAVCARGLGGGPDKSAELEPASKPSVRRNCRLEFDFAEQEMR